jgi:hypothetical protein
MFHYTSVQSHGYITPEGKKLKETRVNVENGRGTKTVTITDHKGTHSDTISLNSSEIKNIQKQKFMPNLFKKSLKNIRKKSKQTHHMSKKGTRKSKK